MIISKNEDAILATKEVIKKILLLLNMELISEAKFDQFLDVWQKGEGKLYSNNIEEKIAVRNGGSIIFSIWVQLLKSAPNTLYLIGKLNFDQKTYDGLKGFLHLYDKNNTGVVIFKDEFQIE